MSTDPYPEVSVDESGIVPPQAARTSEWPKKLRTLTAAELEHALPHFRSELPRFLLNIDDCKRAMADLEQLIPSSAT